MLLERFKIFFEWINMENREFLGKMIELLENGGDLESIAVELYGKNINFSQIAILLDALYTEVKNKEKFLKNRDVFAYHYMKKRLPLEMDEIKKGIHNNPSLVSSKDIEVITELLKWMEELVDSFTTDSKTPQINGRFERFEKYVEEKSGIFFDDKQVRENFLKTNKKLYALAQSSVEFVNKKEYFYFMLSFVDLVAQFLKMVTLLGSMFLESELLSVYIDPVTLLPNRFQLIKDIKFFKDSYIMILNAVGFSKFNILYGFDKGDLILKKVASVLKLESVKAYRIYGDEFAVIVESEEKVKELFEKINSMKITIPQTDQDVCFYGAYDRFEDKSLELCEFALSKSSKRGLVKADDVKELMKRYKKDLSMAQKLKDAMLKDNIIPYFQPIYVCRPVQKILKYEVLMRVKYEDEILSPFQFMDILMELPIYTEFTKSMLLKSFEMFKNNDLTFSVNFTLADIKDKSVKVFLKTLIDKYPDTVKRLTIEITEAEALREFDVINEFIDSFKKYGVSFALDDFGSGYANFTQVAKLHIDIIKIDGTIVQELIGNEKMQKLLDSMLVFARGFEFSTVAEFVSNKELFDYLCEKTDMLQGFYIGKPESYLLT